MKKLLSIMLRIVCVLSFAACSSNKTEPVEPVEPVEEAVKFTRGTWYDDNTHFVNESTGLDIVLNEDYMALSDERLVDNYLGGEDIDLASWSDNEYETELSIPDCAFVNYYTGANTGILYENLAAEKALSITEDQYISISTKRLEGSFENFAIGDIYDMTLSGQSYRAIDLSYDTNGRTVSQTMAVRKVGNYMTIIVFTAVDGDSASMNDMIGFFG